jgi:hypothetical protein
MSPGVQRNSSRNDIIYAGKNLDRSVLHVSFTAIIFYCAKFVSPCLKDHGLRTRNSSRGSGGFIATLRSAALKAIRMIGYYP